MENLEAFKDSPKCVVVPNDVPKVEPYKPSKKSVRYRVADTIDAEIDYAKKEIRLKISDHDPYKFIMFTEIAIPFPKVPDVLQFLAWAQREKIQEEE